MTAFRVLFLCTGNSARSQIAETVLKGMDRLEATRWDFVITVCDRAREACPVFPGQPVLAHWGMPDPAEVEGSDAAKRAAFADTMTLISRRIDLLLALPVEKLDRLVLEAKVRAIGGPRVASSSPST